MNQFIGYHGDLNSRLFDEIAKCALLEHPEFRKVEVRYEDQVVYVIGHLTMQGEIDRIKECYEGKL
jgi:hypothetical protein